MTNVVVSADLWFPGHQDSLGWPFHAGTLARPGTHAPDPTRFVVWVPPGRPNDELAPRVALHIREAA